MQAFGTIGKPIPANPLNSRLLLYAWQARQSGENLPASRIGRFEPAVGEIGSIPGNWEDGGGFASVVWQLWLKSATAAV